MMAPGELGYMKAVWGGRKQGWLEEAAVGLEPGSSLCALRRLLEHQLLSTELQNTVHLVVQEEGH